MSKNYLHRNAINPKSIRKADRRGPFLKYEVLESRQLLATIDLATLTASQGATFQGTSSGWLTGDAVGSAGDVNGDGYDDMIVGANSSNLKGFAGGAAFVVFGGPSLGSSLGAGLTILPESNGNKIGWSVSGAGDVNGDGFDDLLVGAPNFSPFTGAFGAAYIVYGGASLSGTLDLENLGSGGVKIRGVDSGDQTGRSVSGAGDLNGDGFDDIVVGAWRARAAGNLKPTAGENYVVFGSATMPAVIDLAVPGAADIHILGADVGDASGFAVSGAGDVNGDGFDDLLIGANGGAGPGNSRSSAGESYLIFGAAALPSTIDLAVPGSFNVLLYGKVGDGSGLSVSGAGDVNGDGFDDVLISAHGDEGTGYVVFGAANLPASIDMTAMGSAGVRILGIDFRDAGIDVNSGGSVSGGGDINGDGYDDLIIGFEEADAAGNAKNLAGETVVVFGGPNLPAVIDLSNPAQAGLAGITVFGADAGDKSGKAVGIAGDVNGDGFADFLIGAPLADGSDNATTSAGEVALIYGGNGFTSSVTHLGTAGSQTLTGNAAANVMVGGRGDDLLLGNGGADVLIGGEGDDVLAVASLPFKRVDGGNGFDTLRLDGNGHTLNLASLPNNRILGIEQIDIRGNGVNTLTLGFRDVLNISNESNQLIIRRNGGDIVNIGGGWTQGADQVISSVRYQVYTQGNAKLLVEGRTINGSAGNNAYVLTYSGLTTAGTVSITVSTNGGPLTNVGTFSMNQPLLLQGLSGTDSIRVVGTGGADAFTVINNSLIVNGAGLQMASIENRTLVGVAGNDVYRFDADAALGLWTVDEAGGGIDTIDLALTKSVAVSLNLRNASTQVVNANLSLNLGSITTFENAIGGSGTDSLTGNSLANVLTGGPGNDILNGQNGNDILFGGFGDDTYVFGAASSAEADEVVEYLNQGTDLLSFAALTSSVLLNLGNAAVQPVHANRTLKLNSSSNFENAFGGSNADTLIGNLQGNRLIGGTGNDILSGLGGNDILLGGLDNDTYIFGSSATAEADQVEEYLNQGTDLLSFASMTSSVIVNLGSVAVQNVHTNRTLKLNSNANFENVLGGTAADTLMGNSSNNRLMGGEGNNILVGLDGNDILEAGNGRDLLIGGLGLDTIRGNGGDDILIAGRTTSDLNLVNLNNIRAEWVSAGSYAARTANLRAGVGSPIVSLKAQVNVLNDTGEDDVLTGGLENDWYFRATDDVITDLFAGEIIDLL